MGWTCLCFHEHLNRDEIFLLSVQLWELGDKKGKSEF